MLQRIQSIYLLLSAVLAALLIFFPIVKFLAEGQMVTLEVFSVSAPATITGLPNPSLIGILTALLAVLCLATIFQYGNRKFQMKLNGVALLINFALLITIFVISDKIAAHELIYDKPEYQIASFFPVASVLFIILANRSIRRDEALVRKSDRLR